MVLITNATGFVGRALVHRLVANGRKVCCLLQPSQREQRLPTGISFSNVLASMRDLPALRSAMQDVTAVVHLGWRIDGSRERRIEDVANLVEATRETGVRRFVYLSRLGADRTSAYPVFRLSGEVEAVVRESGLDTTILRTTIPYGPEEDMFINVLAMLAKAIPVVFPIPALGRSRFQPLWVMDLARCIADTLERDDLIEQTVSIGGPEHFTFEQLVMQILAAIGVRRRLVRVRMTWIQSAILLGDVLLPRPPTPPWWLDLLAVGSAADLTTVQRHFDFEPRCFAEGLDYMSHKRSWRRDLARFVLRLG